MNLQPTPIARMLRESRGRAFATEPAVHRPGTGQDARPARRARLVDLDSHIHCSIIGTCLSTSELRRLVPRFKELDRERATDLEIHHAAVELAGEGGAGSKAVQKALDDRHQTALKRFRDAATATELTAAWRASLTSGDIPGAYWALMTHPAATTELRGSAFGEVHMLSHLVGAANRADIRRLLALEHENEELKCKIGRQQQRLQEMNTRHQCELQQQLKQAARDLGTPGRPAEPPSELDAEIGELKSALAAKDRALAHQTRRRELAEQALERHQEAAQALAARLDRAVANGDALEAEVKAMEGALVRRLESSAAENAANEFLKGKRVIYVGGRPGSNRAIASLVESVGGELLVHDGGIEDRKGLLAASMATADMVVFPVDCIDHDSMTTLKRVCERHRVPFHPLRTASVASFSALLATLALPPADGAPTSVSRFCLRHG